ncbi:MAG TPA: hypothetical protein VJ739_00230 [Gemmataceae bacterium]|nr:hypothetical protein [Gemmataceae bacterium]
MSDAPPAPPPHPDGRAVEEHPEVAFEPRDANVRVIVVTGIILVVVAVVIYLLLWWMFNLLEAHHNAVKEVSPPLVRQEANQPPEGPPLEGIQATNGTLTVQADDGTRMAFAIDGPIPVVRGDSTKEDGRPLTVFDLDREKEAVTVVYETPLGQEASQKPTAAVAANRVITVQTPPEREGLRPAAEAHRLAFTGHITQVVAVSPAYRHLEAEAELRRTGWVDRKKGVVRIPIDTAMNVVAAEDGGGKAGKAAPPADARPEAAPPGRRP